MMSLCSYLTLGMYFENLKNSLSFSQIPQESSPVVCVSVLFIHFIVFDPSPLDSATHTGGGATYLSCSPSLTVLR